MEKEPITIAGLEKIKTELVNLKNIKRVSCSKRTTGTDRKPRDCIE